MTIKKIPWIKLMISGLFTGIIEFFCLTPIKKHIAYKDPSVIKNNRKVESIPLIEYYQDHPKNKKLIILQHGYLSKKEDQKYFALKLAAAGYLVLTPDALGHGERKEPNALGIFEIIKQSVFDYNKILKAYEKTNRDFIIIGQSMGGMIAYYYLIHGAYKPQLIGATISTPDLSDLINYELGLSYYKNHQVHRLKDPLEIQRYNQEFKENNPYDKITTIEDTPMVVQNMRFDFLLGCRGSDRLYQAWKDKKGPALFQYNKITAFFHYVPDRAKKNIIDFLELHR